MDMGEFSLKLATGETQLKIMRETLSANELRLKAEQDLFDTANKTFQDAATGLQNNIDLINTLGQQARGCQGRCRAGAKDWQRRS